MANLSWYEISLIMAESNKLLGEYLKALKQIELEQRLVIDEMNKLSFDITPEDITGERG